MAGISPIGNDWRSAQEHLRSYRNAVVRMPEWDEYNGLHTRLGAPAAAFESALATFTVLPAAFFAAVVVLVA
eukprot:gene11956-15209_t